MKKPHLSPRALQERVEQLRGEKPKTPTFHDTRGSQTHMAHSYGRVFRCSNGHEFVVVGITTKKRCRRKIRCVLCGPLEAVGLAAFAKPIGRA